MKQSEEYRSRHSMEVPGKSTEVPGKSTEVPGKSTEAPDNCQELPWSRKKSLYGCHDPRHDRKSDAGGESLKLVKEFCPIFFFRTAIYLMTHTSFLV